MFPWKLGNDVELCRVGGLALGGLRASGRNVVLADDLMPAKKRIETRINPTKLFTP